MPTQRSGQRLSHYRLVEKIGKGGMGVVWKAEDTILGRTVAIKVLPPDVATDEGRRRMFLDEARRASSVSDAHIAQVFELGREGGLDFIVMEYVEGKPLSSLLQGRPLAPDRVAALGHQVAQALSRAHRKGLLHRDLKPSNMLVTQDGEVKVVDFGLATLFERDDASPTSVAGSHATTVTGDRAGQRPEAGQGAALVGTLPYMSPEQVCSEKLDGRSDIFSLGVVLYEMTTGRRPFSGATNAELLKEIQRARARPPHELSQEVPLDLERIIQKAIAPGRADRYQTMDDLSVDLRRLSRELESGSSPSFGELRPAPVERRRSWARPLAGALMLVAVGVGAWFVASRWAGLVDAHTILILPMEVRGKTEGAEYVGRAFAEALAMTLSQWNEIKVLPVPEGEDLRSAAGSRRVRAALGMGAGFLVTGALSREKEVVHVSLSLVDTDHNRVVWGAQKSDDAGTLPGLAAFFSRGIAAKVGAPARKRYDFVLNLTGSPAMASSPEAIQALAALRRFDRQQALDLTQRLVEKFPHEPDALALRACAVFYARGFPGVGEKALGKALADLNRADPDNPTGTNIRCDILASEGKEPKKAITCASALLARDDLTPAARAWPLRDRAVARNVLSDTSGALKDILEASRLDPTNHYNFQVLALIRKKAGDLDGAEVAFRQCTYLAPEHDYCYWSLARLLQEQGRWKESVGPAGRAAALAPHRVYEATYAYALLKTGKKDDARAAAEKAAGLPGAPAEGAEELIRIWALLGNRTEALRLLRHLVNSDDFDPDFLNHDDLGSLRADDGFKSLVADIDRSTGTSSETQGERP